MYKHMHTAHQSGGLTPGKLRKRLSVTQLQLAGRLRVTQPSVANIEGRQDPQLGSLRRYVKALGGTLEVHAVFPDAIYQLESPKPRV